MSEGDGPARAVIMCPGEKSHVKRLVRGVIDMRLKDGCANRNAAPIGADIGLVDGIFGRRDFVVVMSEKSALTIVNSLIGLVCS
jgi:hypothetical protein